MVTAADTSFLFSLYGNDAHSGKAVAWLEQHSQPISLNRLNEFELGNALRFAEFKSFLGKGKAETYWSDFLEDLRKGHVCRVSSNLARVLEEAIKLSASRTLKSGHRSFDILHVAGAVVMGAGIFLTFDQNQARLASSVGLNVPEGLL